MPARASVGRLALLVEGLPVPLWIISPLGDDLLPLKDRYVTLLDALAYWARQCTPSLSHLLAPFVSMHAALYVTVQLPINEWTAVNLDNVPSSHGSSVIMVAVEPGQASIALRVHPAIFDLADASHNEADRALLTALLEGLYTLATAAGVSLPEKDPFVMEVVAKYAPLGRRKRLLKINTSVAPDMDPHGLLPARTVRQAATKDAIHRLLTFIPPLAQTTTKAEYCKVLDARVTVYYKELSKTVAALDPVSLMEDVVAAHEAIVRGQATCRFNIPTLAATLPLVPDVLQSEWSDAHAFDYSAVAVRFLIEYIVACPASGRHVLSLEAYDRLLALAALIVETATERDLIRDGIMDIGTGPVSRKEFIARRSAYMSASSTYQEEYRRGGTARLTHTFIRHWEQGEEQQTIFRRLSMGKACRRRRARGVGGRIDPHTEVRWRYGRHRRRDRPSRTLPLDVLTARLTEKLSWSGAQVNVVLELLSLHPRPDFLSPPPGYKKHDVYPWRYNRPLSYLRRPLLLCTGDSGPIVLWGPRHLHTAGQHLINLIGSGRLQATSLAMKSLMGEMVNREGREFNDAVADLLQKNTSLVVRRRVPVRDGHIDLGDIDVLVADQAQRRLWALECKAIAAGRMAHELSSEVRKLFMSENGEGSPFEKHSARAAWLSAHLAETLVPLGLTEVTGWTIEALIVVDLELLTPHLRQTHLPVVPYEGM